jgi:hypothetical protein
MHLHATHTPDRQSEPEEQVQSPHDEHEPPQSMSVSSPFLTPSAQFERWHTFDLQILLTQSALISQRLPSGHGAQGPPQSTSVSAPH